MRPAVFSLARRAEAHGRYGREDAPWIPILVDACVSEASTYAAESWMLLDTGLRLSDALNLRWANVSLEENVIRVVTQKKDRPVSLPV